MRPWCRPPDHETTRIKVRPTRIGIVAGQRNGGKRRSIRTGKRRRCIGLTDFYSAGTGKRAEDSELPPLIARKTIGSSGKGQESGNGEIRCAAEVNSRAQAAEVDWGTDLPQAGAI